MAQVTLENLEIYSLSRELSGVAWNVYGKLDWQQRKGIGDQFLRASDSVGTNIAEGFGRFHYLDKVRFYYNARGSLFESLHWFKLLDERGLLTEKSLEKVYRKTYTTLAPKLNVVIRQTAALGKK